MQDAQEIYQSPKSLNHYFINQGARLFEPRSKATNKLVSDKSKEVFNGRHNNKFPWIGINDRNTESQFVYTSSGERIIISNWKSGEPNNYGGNENCVHFDFNEVWNDDLCSKHFYFICEIIS